MTVERNPRRLGTKYSASGSSLSTSYDFGSVFYCDVADSLNLFVEITADGTNTALTAVTVKVQGRYSSAGQWDDLESIDINNASQSVEHAYSSLPAAGVTGGYGPVNFDPRAYTGGLRVGVKVTRGSTKSGDAVAISAAIG